MLVTSNAVFYFVLGTPNRKIMTAGIATAINITFGDLPHGMDENDSVRAREAQKISHDSKLLHLNGDTYVDHSVEHQNAVSAHLLHTDQKVYLKCSLNSS